MKPTTLRDQMRNRQTVTVPPASCRRLRFCSFFVPPASRRRFASSGARLFTPFVKGGRVFPLAFLLISSLSCNAPATTFPYATVEYNCAPNDAIALDFYFTAEKTACEKRSEPYIMIELWANAPKSGPRDYAISYGTTKAVASRCLEHGKCVAAKSGTLHIEKFNESPTGSEQQGSAPREKIVSGSYELHFPDGSSEKSSFSASWCHPYFVCG